MALAGLLVAIPAAQGLRQYYMIRASQPVLYASELRGAVEERLIRSPTQIQLYSKAREPEFLEVAALLRRNMEPGDILILDTQVTREHNIGRGLLFHLNRRFGLNLPTNPLWGFPLDMAYQPDGLTVMVTPAKDPTFASVQTAGLPASGARVFRASHRYPVGEVPGTVLFKFSKLNLSVSGERFTDLDALVGYLRAQDALTRAADLSRKAYALKGAGKVDQAAALYRQSLDTLQTSRAADGLGSILLGRQRVEEALPLLTFAATTRRDRADYWSRLGRAQALLDQNDAALASYETAAKLPQVSPWVFLALAQLYQAKGQFERSHDAYVTLAGGVGEKGYLLKAVEVRLFAGQLEAALEECLDVAAQHPEFGPARAMAARCYEQLKRPQEAYPHAIEAARLMPERPEIVVACARYHVHFGHIGDALDLLTAALERSPQNADLRRELDRVRSIETGQALPSDTQQTTSPSTQTRAPEQSKPNIVWLLLDACRVHLGCYGYDRATSPNIDTIASRGVVFEKNFCQAVWTVRSLSSYMTGRYYAVDSIGVYGASLQPTVFPPEGEEMLPDILKDNGYETALVGPSGYYFTERTPFVSAFDEFRGVKPKDAPAPTFEELNREILAYLEKPHEKPFFLYVHALDTHFPHNPAPPYDTWMDPEYDQTNVVQSEWFAAKTPDGQAFSPGDKDYLRGLHDGSIAYSDHHVGAVVSKLEELGLLENTLIIIGADHGDALGEDGKTVGHGADLTQNEVIQVPLIMAGPGLPSGKRVSCLTENVDIVPTLIELFDLVNNANVEGQSLVPVIFDESAEPVHEYVFYRGGYVRGLRDEEYKYEYNVKTQEEALYLAPDRVARRANVLSEYPQVGSRLKEVLFTESIPRWRALGQLPLFAVFLNADKLLPKVEGHQHAVIRADDSQDLSDLGQTDNRWLLFEHQLLSASFSEDAPPLHFRHERIQNREYRVLMEVYCDDDFAGMPAASLRVRVEDDPDFKLVSCDTADSNSGEFVYVDLGVYRIRDGCFDIVVDNGAETDWAAFKSFALIVNNRDAQAEFTRLFGKNPTTRADFEESMELLEGLGYLE